MFLQSFVGFFFLLPNGRIFESSGTPKSVSEVIFDSRLTRSSSFCFDIRKRGRPAAGRGSIEVVGQPQEIISITPPTVFFFTPPRFSPSPSLTLPSLSDGY